MVWYGGCDEGCGVVKVWHGGCDEGLARWMW